MSALNAQVVDLQLRLLQALAIYKARWGTFDHFIKIDYWKLHNILLALLCRSSKTLLINL